MRQTETMHGGGKGGRERQRADRGVRVRREEGREGGRENMMVHVTLAEPLQAVT